MGNVMRWRYGDTQPVIVPVDSAILSIEHITRDFFTDCNESLFLAVMKSVFGKKRKQIPFLFFCKKNS